MTHLELFNCLLKPPSTFKGFKSLKSLDLQHVTLAQDVFENMVLRCPLLEKLIVMNFDGFSHLNIDALNLQFFDVGGKFEDVNFKSTSNLAVVSIGLYEHVGNSYRRLPSSSSNLLMFFAYLPGMKCRIRPKFRNVIPWTLTFMLVRLEDAIVGGTVDLQLGTKRELEFIKFLLLSSPALERMTVKPASVDCAWKIVKTLPLFRRALVQAEILYVDP
ncbi:hypothetical protein C1H46_036534 [Malus baccata]|uniref:F-box/LRR-repeat protein 15/At3g58940/PEG3-like LRR domain-containing protein n=1 Tax=Malus baccata TaxID=106549 RepID=A0A540KVB9_MALBA|nr:hypothetical protein C1H46_036534 [Malus baccata]